MDSAYASMKCTLQDALDSLVSARSSQRRRGRALAALEHLLALECLSSGTSDDEGILFALQDTFECNIPCRMLPWVSASTTELDRLIGKSPMDLEHEARASLLSSQLSQCLFIIQGVILNHPESKQYMGRRYALEILIDLLQTSRHLCTNTQEQVMTLSSVVVDTLLCILVDSPFALRVFEESNGVRAIVKLLKRAETSKEVRMKCLEFLYFYLLDETRLCSAPTRPTTPTQPDFSSYCLDPPPTTPSSPVRYPSTTVSFNSRQSWCSGYTTSTPSESSFFGHLRASPSISTPCSSNPPSPFKPVPSTSFLPHTPTALQPPPRKRFSMLRREVSFVPQSPKKPAPLKEQIGNPIVRMHRKGAHSLASLSDFEGSQVWDIGEKENVLPGSSAFSFANKSEHRQAILRTTEQKKELLGELLSNVDSLVEGVRKAGLWGLG